MELPIASSPVSAPTWPAGTSLAAFAAGLAGAVWLVSGASGWLFVVCYGLAIAPGVPIGLALFGGPAGVLAGALLGYAMVTVALWVPVALGVGGLWTFALAWMALAASSAVARTRLPAAPLVTLPRWTSTTTSAWLLVMALTLTIAIPPLAHIGRQDAEGNRYYRAYFTADFVWHEALTAELTKFSMPPRNPYLAHRPLHYYWAYFVLPAALAREGPRALGDVGRVLALDALMTGVLLMSAVFLCAWAATARAWAAGAATALALVASSAEGLVALYRLWARGQPLGAVRNLNIDAVSAWAPFGGLRIDGLQRCLWYVPQHSMSYALGLIAIVAATAGGSRLGVRALLITGGALAGAVAFNPFVGGIFAIAYAVAVAVDAVRRPRPINAIARQAWAALPVAIAIVWCIANQMVDGAGGALEFGVRDAAAHEPLTMLMLSLGPVVVLAAAGLVAAAATDRFPDVAPAAALAGISLVVMYAVRLSVDRSWVGFRAGQMLLVAAPALIAALLAWGWPSTDDADSKPVRWRRPVVVVFAALALVVGVPTTIIDVYNAQDTTNLAMGPGFPWTLVVTPSQQHAYRWIREHTPASAIVQMDATLRERSTWSQIPSFAERRMSAGIPLSLLEVPEYREGSERVKTMYHTQDPAEAWRIARAMRIDFVYADDVERRAHPSGALFGSYPQYFEQVFHDGPVDVYRVR